MTNSEFRHQANKDRIPYSESVVTFYITTEDYLYQFYKKPNETDHIDVGIKSCLIPNDDSVTSIDLSKKTLKEILK